jgi:hypothetical protein
MNHRDTISKAKFIFDALVRGKYIQDKKFEDITMTQVYHLQNIYDDIAKDFKPVERDFPGR